ncbi:hypothetical protein OIV83_005431 [Microbotryomycetes sp. JL201]|nr:hypothetical protein OIV83_005431 [Microbotryomycetes sp. JL201]
MSSPVTHTGPSSATLKPLDQPLPSHPGLSSRTSSRPDHHGLPHVQRNVSAGALSTLSLLLGSSSSNNSIRPASSRTHTGEKQLESNLLKRRRGPGSTDTFNLGPLSSLWPGARSTNDSIDSSKLGGLGHTDEHQANIARKAKPKSSALDCDEDSDLPPSPVGLPGAWTHGPTETEGALLLPPPFLDDRSTKESFEGVLGTRFARETSARARREARNYARDRPPPPAFPASLLATASKLVSALGPPGGVDSGPMYRRWKDDPDDPTPGSIRKSRRQVERAEKGMKGLELGEKIARRLADRLRRERGQVDAENGETLSRREAQVVQEVVKEVLSTATPMSILGVPSTPASPPLFGFPTPAAYEDTPPTSVSDEIDSPAAPPKPFLKPLIDAAEPSPLPSPMLLDRVGTPAGQKGETGDYFTLRQRTRSQRRIPSQLTSLERIRDRSIKHDQAAGPSGITSRPSYLGKQLSRPTSEALRKLRSQLRAHLDLALLVLVGRPDAGAPIDQSIASVGGILGILVHLVGFLAFVLVHVWALIVSAALAARSITFFMHWTFLNLTGRTDLSIVVKDYYKLCRHEWDAVCVQDGVRLSAWSVMLGLLELTAVQASKFPSLSKERWLQEGPGQLVLLNCEDELDSDQSVSLPAPAPLSPEMQARTTVRSRSFVERPRTNRRNTRNSLTMDDGIGGSSLIVTGGGDSILEGRILNDPFDQLTLSPRSFSTKSDAVKTVDDDDLPPLDLGGALPGFSFPPSPIAFSADGTASSSPPLRPIDADHDPKSDFFALLKRHVRLATASYGLHSYILAPPSPLFTPSVNQHTLPHKVFSHLSGVDCNTSTVLHVAIQKHYTGVPATTNAPEDLYEPQFYLLRDDMHGEVVCVVRGTQSLADIRTDLEAGFEAVSLPPTDPGSNSKETYLAHSGILAAARRLLDRESSPLFAKLRAALEETGYSLVFNGHSLGAAIASTLAVLVGEYASESESGHWTTSVESGLPSGRPVRAICFAHPTTTNLALARRCSLGSTPLVVSVSFGPDAVCRMGIPQVRELRRALGRLARNRRKWIDRVRQKSAQAEGDRSNVSRWGPKHGKSEILSAWWRWKKLGGGSDMVEDGLALDPSQSSDKATIERRAIEDKAWRWRREVDGDVADDIVNGQDPATLMAIPAGKCFHIDKLPRSLELKRKKQREDETVRKQAERSARENSGQPVVDKDVVDEDEDEQPLYGIYSVENPSKFYSLPWLEADLVKSHLPREYLDCLSAL